MPLLNLTTFPPIPLAYVHLAFLGENFCAQKIWISFVPQVYVLLFYVLHHSEYSNNHAEQFQFRSIQLWTFIYRWLMITHTAAILLFAHPEDDEVESAPWVQLAGPWVNGVEGSQRVGCTHHVSYLGAVKKLVATHTWSTYSIWKNRLWNTAQSDLSRTHMIGEEHSSTFRELTTYHW